MFDSLTTQERTLAIRRLTALWALNECGLGGILHALNSPFTGLLVGSFAMICIAFIFRKYDETSILIGIDRTHAAGVSAYAGRQCVGTGA